MSGASDPVEGSADVHDGTQPPAGGPATGPGADATDLERRTWRALGDVEDLHIPVSLVDMGMIYGVDVDPDEGAVTVEMTFPCMGCPGYEMLQGDVRTRLESVRGVESVEVAVVWEPLWTKDMIAMEAREALYDYGIGL